MSIPLAGASWIKLNAGQNGFFRVNYAPDDWQALAKALDDDVSVHTRMRTRAISFHCESLDCLFVFFFALF